MPGFDDTGALALGLFLAAGVVAVVVYVVARLLRVPDPKATELSRKAGEWTMGTVLGLGAMLTMAAIVVGIFIALILLARAIF